MVTTGGTNLKDDILRLTEPGKYVEAVILSLFLAALKNCWFLCSHVEGYGQVAD